MNFLSFDLSMEQEFEIQKVKQEVQGMSREQALELLLEVSKTLMIKDNLIRDLMKRARI
ncbi:MAG: NblA/ycf18 family protein [Synechococcales cyanobacterium T60_A2020_003]|nr:NblA/ycf18 family protein [Synechococcales cyanobacterium T60_A2020_003]